jgi:transcriptional regulator with XRE-family HTH domain
MKQEEVARKMGIKKQRYSQLENHPNLRKEREEQILTVLGYTMYTAKNIWNQYPPPPPFSTLLTLTWKKSKLNISY